MKTQCPQCSASFDPHAGGHQGAGGSGDVECPVCGNGFSLAGPETSLPDFDLGQEVGDDFTMNLGDHGSDRDEDPAAGDPFAMDGDSLGGSDPFGGVEVGFLDDFANEDDDDDLIAPAAPQPRAGFAMGPGPTFPPDEPEPPQPERPAASESRRGDELGFTGRGGREISGLTEMDLSMIGSYSRTKGSLDYTQDVVWSANDARRQPRDEAPRAESPRKEAPRKESALDDDPFSAPERPAEAASSGRAGASRPSRAAVVTENPFDPIGSSTSTASGGSGKRKPVADDPFADLGGGGLDDDVFADVPRKSGGGREGAAAKKPVADAGVDEMDFSSLLADPSDPGLDDLFGPSAAESDEPRPRRVAASEPQPSSGEDPFQRREDTNTFFIEAPSMSGFAGGASDPAPDGGGGDLFELDMPSVKPKSPGAPPDALAAAAKKRARAPKAKKSRGAPLPTKAIQVKTARVSGGRKALAGLLVLLIVAGVGLKFAGFGWFGTDLLFPPMVPQGAIIQKGPGGPVAAAGRASDQTIKDTTRAYQAEIDALEKQLKANAQDTAAKERLVSLYLEYNNRFPRDFAGNEKFKKRYEELSKQVEVTANPRLHALELMRDGKLEDAKAALDEAVATAAADPEILFAYGQIEHQKGNGEKAIEYFTKATELLPGMVKAHYFKGKVLEEMGEYDRAAVAYQAALEKNPNHTQSRLGIVRLQLVGRDVDTAIKNATDVLSAAQKENNTEDQFLAHRLLASAYGRKNDVDDRVKHLESAVQIKPNDEETVLELAELYVRTNQLDKAETRLLACEKSGCSSTQFFDLVVDFYMEPRKNLEDAERFADLAAKKHPDNADILFLQGQVAEARRLRKNARAIYQSVIDKDPTKSEAYSRLAQLYADDERYDQATRVLEQGIESSPTSLTLLAQLAEMNVATGQRVKAKDAFKQLVAKDPSNAKVRMRLAALLADLGYIQEALEQYEVLYSQGHMDTATTLAYADTLARAQKHKKAIDELESLLQTDPQNLEANARLGALYIEIQSFRTARKYVDMALKINPSYAPAFYELGRLYLAQDEPDQAITQLQKAVSASPRKLDYRHALAKALVKKGGANNRRLALQQYSNIIDEYAGLSASSADLKNSEVYLERGDLLFDAGQYRDALADFEKAMLMDSGRLDFIASYAETLFKLKKGKDAESYFREILKKDANYAVANYYLGKLALQRGNRQKAMDHFNLAVRQGGSEFPDAHKTLGFMYREKNMIALARREFELYLKTADATAYDREEIERLVGRLR